ncbi:type 1 glutamine amidotransferase [Tianweitania sp. BSSL-BM11]|uniref:Type 1 glutamine amidotransferase n=1 Tax=Tianweitania aestuarii TaxID=2814886 RepID=A0ABS5RY81_9HYPH|nr:type 1 glutamine amidotransferase [Tianweitania aestuarii]
MPLRLLVVATETAEQCEARRKYAGSASHESYAETLRALHDGAEIQTVSCVDQVDPLTGDEVGRFDGIFFAGSPIQMHKESFESRAATRFMQKVFDAGTPSFGSCAGLQIAAVAAGGKTGPRSNGMEAAFARDIVMTSEGQKHPMLAGRPAVFDAPAMHSSVIKTLPTGSTLLASNRHTPVEALEIRHGNGVFWGVQYHPEITLGEIAASLRRQSEDLVKEGLASDQAAVEAHAQKLEELDRNPKRSDLAWQLGLDPETTDADRRTLELRNFLAFISQRG